MNGQEPMPATWAALYSAAARFFALKPWRWMLDSDVFGIQNPADGEIGYCCIMGAAEEHYALAVYLGSDGLEVLKNIGLEQVPANPFDVLVSQKCLMASFEDRDMLEPPDFETIRALGLKFRGPRAWPQFRSYLPGFAPWMLTEREALFLTAALDQTCEVSVRYERRPQELGTQNALNNYEQFLVRISSERGGKRVWEDAMERPAPYEPLLILPSPPDLARIAALTAGTKRTDGVLDMDFFYLPSALMDDGDERPWYPHVVLCVDDLGGEVLHFDMVRRGDLGRAFGAALLDVTEKVRQIPATVQVRGEQALILLEPTAAELEVELMLVDALPLIEEAQQGLLNSL